MCLKRPSAHYFQGHGPRFSVSGLVFLLLVVGFFLGGGDFVFVFFFFPSDLPRSRREQGRMTEPAVGSGDALMLPHAASQPLTLGHAGCGAAPLMGFGIIFIPAAKTNREHWRETIKCY